MGLPVPVSSSTTTVNKTGPAVADPAAVISQIGWPTSIEALVYQNHRRQLEQNPLQDR